MIERKDVKGATVTEDRQDEILNGKKLRKANNPNWEQKDKMFKKIKRWAREKAFLSVKDWVIENAHADIDTDYTDGTLTVDILLKIGNITVLKRKIARKV
jgi:hypothetical protein